MALPYILLFCLIAYGTGVVTMAIVTFSKTQDLYEEIYDLHKDKQNKEKEIAKLKQERNRLLGFGSKIDLKV